MGDAETRARLRRLYDEAVAVARPEACLPQHLPAPPAGRIVVAGAGKAAAAMARVTEQHYMAAGLSDRIGGLVTTRHGAGLATGRLEVTEAAHPKPDGASVAAADAALGLAAGLSPDDLLLVLLSGGASALWCAPAAGLSLDAKRALTSDLLRSGAPIGEMNIVRKHLSRIKGGRLARIAAGRGARVLTLAISDVPGDDPASIGSGPTVADPTTLGEARAVLARYGIEASPAIVAALADHANETLKPGDPALQGCEYRIVAAPAASIAAAAALARREGYEVAILGDALEGEARDVARAHAAIAIEALAAGRRVAILSGGELTVTVRGQGRGGPNQEYALALAIALDGREGIACIAGDTDGIDGGGGDPDDPAGAVVLPNSLARARDAGLDPAAFLAHNDSSAIFAKLGDLLTCGPTQTNVNDFRAILVDP